MKKTLSDTFQFLPYPRFPMPGGGFGLQVKKDASLSGEATLLGRSFGGVFSYSVENGQASFVRKIIAYDTPLGEFSFSDSSFTRIIADGSILIEHAERIEEEGRLIVFSKTEGGILTARSFFPCTYAPGIMEKIEIQSPTAVSLSLAFDDWTGFSGKLAFGGALCDENGRYMKDFPNGSERILPVGGYTCFYIFWYIHPAESDFVVDGRIEDARRISLVDGGKSALRLITPDPNYNSAFAHSLLNMRQSVVGVDTAGAFALSSLDDYLSAGIREQIFLSAPIYACMGDERGVAQLINSLNRISAELKELREKKAKNKFVTKIPIEGRAVVGQDMGESAYYVGGIARSLLSLGSAPFCRAYYPDLTYALSCCKEKIGKDGLLKIKGKTDGEVCFAAYLGFYYTALLADQLGERTDSIRFAYFAEELKEAMIEHKVYLPFSLALGCSEVGVEDFENGRFSDVEKMSIIKALFLARKEYAEGVLQIFTEKCMILNKVIGAGDKGVAHAYLSACYADVFLSGVLGFRPLTFTSFSLTPSLSEALGRVRLEGLWIYGHTFDLEIEDNAVALFDEYDKLVFRKEFEKGETVVVSLEKK